MFQFPGYAPIKVTGLQPAGFPHSDTCGSIRVCQSPQIFAAYRVLLRLWKPRHPPFALIYFVLNHSAGIYFAVNFLCLWNCSPSIVRKTWSISDYLLLTVFYLVISLNSFNELCSGLCFAVSFPKRAAKVSTFFYSPNYFQKFFNFLSQRHNRKNMTIFEYA